MTYQRAGRRNHRQRGSRDVAGSSHAAASYALVPSIDVLNERFVEVRGVPTAQLCLAQPFRSERVKFNHHRRRHVNAYFWRTYDRAELDYLEEEGGRLVGFECKWTATRWRPPAAVTAAYAESETHLLNRDNSLDFLTP